jgi:hypothetical protein
MLSLVAEMSRHKKGTLLLIDVMVRYVSTRQHTPAYASIRQHTSAYGSIRQHTAAYVSILSLIPGCKDLGTELQ